MNKQEILNSVTKEELFESCAFLYVERIQLIQQVMMAQVKFTEEGKEVEARTLFGVAMILNDFLENDKTNKKILSEEQKEAVEGIIKSFKRLKSIYGIK